MNLKIFKNKNLLITGGTGSFGSTMIQTLIKSDISEIRIFSRDEKKQNDMRLKYRSNKLKFYIGDVRNINSVNDVMQDIDLVFHAAALKQVPSCEFYPMEAVRTNILGTENVCNSAVINRVSRVVVLSTDKAVYPINAMGISKAMMEKITLAKARICQQKQTIFNITRYGNVMCSRGSVIPLFIDLIKNNLPITITDPNMTRFLMSLEDSVSLVMHAFTKGKQGELFIHKSPACTIKILAIALKSIFNSNCPITYIGTRHGEKLYESLLSREEMSKAKELKDYYEVPYDSRDLNYSEFFEEGKNIENIEDYNSHNTETLNVEKVIDLLLSLDYIKEALKN